MADEKRVREPRQAGEHTRDLTRDDAHQRPRDEVESLLRDAAADRDTRDIEEGLDKGA